MMIKQIFFTHNFTESAIKTMTFCVAFCVQSLYVSKTLALGESDVTRYLNSKMQGASSR